MVILNDDVRPVFGIGKNKVILWAAVLHQLQSVSTKPKNNQIFVILVEVISIKCHFETFESCDLEVLVLNLANKYN